MNKEDALLEVTSLSDEDCFLVIQRPKPGFYYPLHEHVEFELNYLENVEGAIRIVGDGVEEMKELDLVLIGGGIRHAYSNHTCLCEGIFEITIQFNRTLFDSLIEKRHFKTIKEMFEKASCGLVFSSQAILEVQKDLKMLSTEDPASFLNLLRLIKILKILSLDQQAHCVNPVNRVKNQSLEDADRLDSIMRYLHKNYQSHVSLEEIASLINMSESSLTRFLKRWTGKTFIDNLNDIRIAEAVCRLIDTSDSISEICYKCGFNNLSNFNRIFKRRKGMTPTKYREYYARTRFRI
ncbi:AraC family transcriptional regulator [Parabacteroides sp. PF5-9]|uniref:AraC family transcriptional regulator n=1 Tax=Parabacteroides sp. PF5-9 TaxID=1742404 RepID=UPI0024744D07|nr:AraC family transcriptional regulator [Parabacteroides sp. PF5-9]MDH6356710.1 AraC-like DNA-binding protein [Parabacteroides sp. PF5-9]